MSVVATRPLVAIMTFSLVTMTSEPMAVEGTSSVLEAMLLRVTAILLELVETASTLGMAIMVVVVVTRSYLEAM